MNRRPPKLVIVGRPNVGKSTLFNRIVGRRIAVIEDTPGVTRDRLYSKFTHKGRTFELVDTGGILFSDEDPLTEQIRVQAQIALSEADVVLFMVDVASGLTPPDWDLAQHLRGFKRPVYLVVNKVDGPEREDLVGEFYRLGVGDDVYAVSGLHKRGVKEMLDQIADGFPPMIEEEEDPPIRLAIVGRPNVGKSSMLNAYAGEPRVIVSDLAGTTRDAIDLEVTYRGDQYILIDTAGLRRKGKIQGSIEYYMAMRAQTAIRRADCALLVVDGVEGLTDGDKRVAKMAHDEGKPFVIAVNKWDEREPPDGNLGNRSPLKKDFENIIRNELVDAPWAPIRFTSALEESGLEGVMNAVKLAVANWSYRMPTPQLNKLVQDAVYDRPLVRKGKELRVYYATQPDTKPPTFVFFVNNPDLVHFSYQRYLENCIRKVEPLIGTPINVVIRASRRRDDED